MQELWDSFTLWVEDLAPCESLQADINIFHLVPMAASLCMMSDLSRWSRELKMY